MKLCIMSDLHLEAGSDEPFENINADVCILAGDINEGFASIRFAAKLKDANPGIEVVWVPGNHEYYGFELAETRHRFVEAAREEGIQCLDQRKVVMDGYTFLGATLWTDFRYGGDRMEVMRRAHAVNDYARISDEYTFKVRPTRILKEHEEARMFLHDGMDDADNSKTIVVTHHGVTAKAIHPRYERSGLNGYYISEMDAEIEAWKPLLWVHGHIHYPLDVMVGSTRIVANPRHGFLDWQPRYIDVIAA